MYLCSPLLPGEQGNRYPLGVYWLKGQIWFLSCKQRRLWRICTFESRLSLRQCTKTSCAVSNVVFMLFMRAEKAMAKLHICFLPHSSKISCWLKWRFNVISCEQRRLLRVYTFAQAYLSLRHCTKISCAASNGDVCAFRASSVDSYESAYLCRHCHWTMQ